MGSSGELLVRPSVKGHVPVFAVLAGFLVLEVVVAVRGLLEPWLAIACPAVFVVLLGLEAVLLTRSLRKPWQLRCGPDGVEARGFEVVPWSALAQVRISRLGPRWLGFLSPGRYGVVAFVPRQGVSVPEVTVFDALSRDGRSSNWAARRQIRRYGSPFLLLAQTVDATAERVAEAVRALSDVPVVDERPGRAGGA